MSGANLYGMTGSGAYSGYYGTIFSLSTGGLDFTNLHTFNGNGNGSSPRRGLMLSGNTLYGTAVQGGNANKGMVFSVNTDGTGFTNLHSFAMTSGTTATNSDGASPYTSLILLSNSLYGVTGAGGSFGKGTFFSVSLPPPNLSMALSGGNVVLTWPANATGFTLQYGTNIDTKAAWISNSPGPVIVNGQYTVTNPASGKQQFFRLSH
jgi:uncharacterized repeat protein (TIGR03803 family)